MRFWDASAIIPLVIDETVSTEVEVEHARDSGMVVWWGTEVECLSAIARREREGATVSRGRERLDLLAASWAEVGPTSELRRVAARVVRVHPLRAADVFQLSAAITGAEGDPGSLPFLTYDDRLAEAASKEGFPVLSPGA